MKKYPAYKDCGIEWIGEIPEHWEVKPIKYVGEMVLGKMLTPNDKGGYFRKPYLRAQNITWEKVDTEDIKEMWFSEKDLSQYRLKENDLLVSEGGEVGRTAIWKNELSECYIQNSVHKITMKSKNNPHYYLYHFQIYGKTGYFDSIVSRVSIAHLTREKLKEIMFLSPTLSEQQSIANYLDRKTLLIDTLIENKQKLIALLKEQRAAIINQAVTKGLNPNVKQKDSGIAWLGEIPEHWELKKLKHVITIKSGEGITREDINEEGTYEVYGGNGFLGFTEDYNVTNDTLIIGRVGAKCGNVHLVCDHKWVTDNALIAKTNQNYRFLFFLLTSMRLNNLANQNAQPLITGTMIKYQIAALPSIDEQDKIVENIESETMRFDTLLRNNQRQIDHLKEYRTALISEVVTGKIDVRDSGMQEVRPS